MGEIIVMTGSFITIFAILICCINAAPREREYRRRHCQKCRKSK